jgi:tRNA G18 (ribose-2'-O)-methylase SpoU
MRGYFAVGIYHPKTPVNIGTLWRSAYGFGASYVFSIGARYRRQSSDTPNTTLQIPYFKYTDFEDFKLHLPYDCPIVAVEITDEAQELNNFHHLPRMIYLLGAEDHGIPQEILNKCHRIVKIGGSSFCFNVAVAGSIVMYDRVMKGVRHESNAHSTSICNRILFA